MRYLVTVEVQLVTTQIVSVEAATENEAGQMAVAIVRRHNGDINKTDVLSVVEDSQPDRNEVDRGKGYIARIL